MPGHPTDGASVIASITIRKTFDDHADGGEAVFVEWSDGLGLADALGMLAFTEHAMVRQLMDGLDDE